MKMNYRGFMREKIERNPVTISPDASFYQARNLIRDSGIPYLPVVDKNHRLVGIVTEREIREADLYIRKAGSSDATTLSADEWNYLLEHLKVSGFMRAKDKVITITTDTLVEEAARLMREHKVRCLPVLEDGKLYGIFTETDALDFLVDIFGLDQKGTRLTIALEDRPGALLGVLEVLKSHEVNVISVVSTSIMSEGKRIAVIRIGTEENEPIVANLEKAGYPVLSIGRWSSVE
jgi:acetoin utilization protein AcuB